MPTSRNTKLPELPVGVRNPLPLRQTTKQFPPKFQEPSVRVNLPDRTAKLTNTWGKK